MSAAAPSQTSAQGVSFPVFRTSGPCAVHVVHRTGMVERFILALRSDFGCLAVIAAFVILMVSAIAFADILTPPSANPFV